MNDINRAKYWRLIERNSGRTIVSALTIADRYVARLIGLQFHGKLPAGHGLLLVPCASVHTFWLRFSLDLAMLGDDGFVLAVRHAVQPWRAVFAPKGTRAVLEMTAGSLAAHEGDRVAIVSCTDGDAPPRSVSFLQERIGRTGSNA